MLKNTPEKFIHNYDVDSVRNAFENAARWYYFLVKEGLSSGLPIDFAYDAMRQSGEFYYEKQFSQVENLPEFIKLFFDFSIEKAYEGTIKYINETKSVLEFGYCPFVSAWQKLTDDEEIIKQLCSGCIVLKRAMTEKLGILTEAESTIASGNGKCVFTFTKLTKQ